MHPIRPRSRRAGGGSWSSPAWSSRGMTDHSSSMEEPMPDLGPFDQLVEERFENWVDELREFCTIPSETAQLPELERAAIWTEQRLRAAGAEVTVLREEGVPPLVV